jgi:phage terminase large subunit-like protein
LKLKTDGDRYRIREIGFDPWVATQLATNLDIEGFNMVQMRQGFGTMAAPSKELEVMVMQRKFEHFCNPVLCWMAKNAQVVRNSNDNLRPRSVQKLKSSVSCGIPVVVAKQTAKPLAAVHPPFPPSRTQVR